MSTAVDLAEATDRVLLDQMVNGAMVRDKDGNVVLGQDGQPLRVAPSAAMVRAALSRIAQLGISGVPIEGSALQNIAEAAAARQSAQLKLGPMPPLDVEGLDAATG